MNEHYNNRKETPAEKPKPVDPIPVDPRLSSTLKKSGDKPVDPIPVDPRLSSEFRRGDGFPIDPIPVDPRLSGRLKETHEREYKTSHNLEEE